MRVIKFSVNLKWSNNYNIFTYFFGALCTIFCQVTASPQQEVISDATAWTAASTTAPKPVKRDLFLYRGVQTPLQHVVLACILGLLTASILGRS